MMRKAEGSRGSRGSRRPAPAPIFPDREDQLLYMHGQTLPAQWTEETYARWLFDFLRTDLATLTIGQQIGMRADAQVFVGPALIEDIRPAAGVENVPALLDESLHPEHRKARAEMQALMPTIETLAQMQQEARDAIRRVRAGESFEVKGRLGYGYAWRGNRLVRTHVRGVFRDLFLAAVMDTVHACWSRLHQCPRCPELFLKIGKRKYCSPACARQTHWEAFKSRRAPRDHHREYVGRIKKRVGPNVTARRRKPK